MFFDFYWVEFIGIVFLWMMFEQNFLQSGWLYLFHLWHLCLRELNLLEGQRFYLIFSWSSSFFFELKILQEDFLYVKFWSLAVHICLDFLMRRFAWHSLMSLHSAMNHCLSYFGGRGVILLAMVMRMLIKCIIDSSWFVFVSEISVVKQFFEGFPVYFLKIWSLGFWHCLWFCVFYDYWVMVTITRGLCIHSIYRLWRLIGSWGLGLWQRMYLRMSEGESEISDCGGINCCYCLFFQVSGLFCSLFYFPILWSDY